VSGVCLIRVEAQRRGVLITLRMIPDADQVSSERVRKAADVETAVQIVREFLREFVPMKTKQDE
jgi:hypothetical protein